MTTRAPKKQIEFIATQYKNRPIEVSFYTTKGSKVNFIETKKIPVKTKTRLKTHK